VQPVEIELGVVVALRGLLGLVVEPVDPGLNVVDVRLGLSRRRRNEADGRGEREA
jgi:hypothetical protein